MYCGDRTLPPHMLCVFSRQTKRVCGKWFKGSCGRIAAFRLSMANVPSGSFGTVRGDTPPN
eukprot:scaffold97_cov261-Pinguiococcus_pyrenoidosus.AAC.34